MREPRVIVAIALFSMGCGASEAPRTLTRSSPTTPCVEGTNEALGEDLRFVCIAPGVWMFTALASADFVYPHYPANGLLIEAGDHAVMVDTAWNDTQARAIATWSALPVRAALATHSHTDRTGGARALIAMGIPVYATEETIALAESQHEAVPDHVLQADSLPELQWLAPGPAHAPDNIVVWHEPTRTLYGGCMIKEASAEALGNVADADLVHWPVALESIASWAAHPSRVVPGHGEVGGIELLAHTRALVTAAQREAH